MKIVLDLPTKHFGICKQLQQWSINKKMSCSLNGIWNSRIISSCVSVLVDTVIVMISSKALFKKLITDSDKKNYTHCDNMLM